MLLENCVSSVLTNRCIIDVPTSVRRLIKVLDKCFLGQCRHTDYFLTSYNKDYILALYSSKTFCEEFRIDLFRDLHTVK